MTRTQIAAEAANGIYERCINQKMWTKSGTLTQCEFLAMMKDHIKAAIKEATKAADKHAAFCSKIANERLEEIAKLKSRAAHASEPLNLNEIRDNALNMIASGINHTLSPDDEEYVKGQLDWVIKQVMWSRLRQPAHASEQGAWTKWRDLIQDGRPRALCWNCGYPELIGSDDCRNCSTNFDSRRITLSQRPTPATGDTKRLDWLEVADEWEMDRRYKFVQFNSSDTANGPRMQTVREAIDTAMQAKEKE